MACGGVMAAAATNGRCEQCRGSVTPPKHGHIARPDLLTECHRAGHAGYHGYRQAAAASP